MKSVLYLSLIMLTLTSINKCEDHDGVDGVNLNETFELELTKSVKVDGEEFGLTFLSNKDSRCPKDVNCIQAGAAKVSLKLMSKDSTEEIVLEAKGICHEEDGSCGESKQALGYNVKLISVNPYPGTDAAKQKDVMKAKLVVSKN